jgi:hypothetical protein
VAELEEANCALTKRVESYEAAAAAAGGGKPKKARGKKAAAAAAAPMSAAAAAMLAAGQGEGEGEVAPAKRPTKGPFFESRPTTKVAWTCDGSGSEAFLAFCKITGATTFNTHMWNEAKWVGDLLGSGDASYNQGLEDGKVANFCGALRVMAEGPWVVDGDTYQSKKMWIARVLWPELKVSKDSTKVAASEEYDAEKAARQLKKVECGIDMVVEACNLYHSTIVPHIEYAPIARTDADEQERIRDEKPMEIISMIRAKARQLAGTDGAQAMISGVHEPAAAEDVDAMDSGADSGDEAMPDAVADLEALQQPAVAEPQPQPQPEPQPQPQPEPEPEPEPEPTGFAEGDKVHFSWTVLGNVINHEGTVVTDDGGDSVLISTKTAGDREMKINRGTLKADWPTEAADAQA